MLLNLFSPLSAKMNVQQNHSPEFQPSILLFSKSFSFSNGKKRHTSHPHYDCVFHSSCMIQVLTHAITNCSFPFLIMGE